MRKRIISLLAMSLLTFGAVSFASVQKTSVQVANGYYNKPTKTYTNHDADTYYSSISSSLTGKDLLNALNSLNSSRQKTFISYKSGMGININESYYIYTDYDPSSVQYDSNGQPYGTRILSFYSGTPTTSWNREHMWPNSHGGNLVESDIHHTRPTIASENGSRGNSFYVEGKADNSNGWDPAMESFGDETYRGDSARVIFYAAIAKTQLTIIDAEYHSTSNSKKDYMMGKLSDLLKWNLKYPVLQREQNRNEGAEYLQGNRNPFIDHPEYACKIWGNTNETTKAICSGEDTESVEIRYQNKKASDTEIAVGDSVEFTSYVNGELSSDASWSLVNEDGGGYLNDKITIESNGNKVTVTASGVDTAYLKLTHTYGESKTIFDRIKITTFAKPVLESLSIENPKTTYYVDDQFEKPDVIATFSDGKTENVKETASFSGFDSSEEGENTIEVSYTSGDVTLSTSYKINILPKPVAKALSYITATNPTTTEYYVGETFDPTGMVVTAYFNDDTSEEVTNYSYPTEPFSKTGNIQVEISYTFEGVTRTAVITVTVKEKETTPSSGDNNPSPFLAFFGCKGNFESTSIILSSISLAGILCIIISFIVSKGKKSRQ
ncbi:MAG: endonuclease [Bacilli bacterium]|nr:endonuclease [Bacilli bacterium]